MKKGIITMVILSTLTMGACKKNEQVDTNVYSIQANAAGFENGTKVYINALSESNRPSIIDSTIIKDETFTITLPNIEQSDFNYLTFNKGIQGNVLFLAENSPLKMVIYKDSLRSSIVQGGADNDLFFSYVNHIKKYQKKHKDLKTKEHVSRKLNELEKLKIYKIDREKLITQEKEFETAFIQKHPETIVSVMILTDLISQKILSAKEVKVLYDNLAENIKTTRLGKRLNSFIIASANKIEVGSEAIAFKAPTPKGELLTLKEAMGKVTIIDFWASWCRPCRMENPNVVKVYEKYHDKGLNIIGVSLDKNKAQWVKAIADDGLEWDHISNLKQWQEPIARLYGVRSVPATFILDESGIVVAQNLRGEALEQKIAELLD